MANKSERIKALIGKNIKDICTYEIKNETIDFFTITEVIISSDHSYATVYVSFFQNANANIEKLNKIRGFVRTSLAKKMSLRRVPEIKFVLDDSFKKEERLEELINKKKVTLDELE